MPAWDEITPHLERKRREGRAPFTGILLVLNLAAFALAAVAGRAGLPDLHSLLAFSAPAVWESFRWWTLLTHPFLHATQPLGGSLLWVLVAGVLLYGCGRRLERDFGWKALLLLYAGAALSGAGVHAIYQAVAGSSVALSGFHGPVAALILADAVRHPDRPARLLMILPLRAATGAWLTVIAITVLGALVPGSGASPFAIAGGTVFTLLAAAGAAKFGHAWSLLAASRERARFLEEFMVRREADEILDKVLRSGVDSLTATERRTLNRASRLLRRQQEAEAVWTVGDANR